MTAGVLFSRLVAFIGWPGIIVLGLLGFYEGVPIVNSIPLIGHVPVIGDLAVGRVGRARIEGGEQVRAELRAAIQRQQAQWNAKRRETQAELDRLAEGALIRETELNAQLAALHMQLDEEMTDADYLCRGPVISERLSKRLDMVGRRRPAGTR